MVITTVGQGLYHCLGLPLPTEPAKEKFPIFDLQWEYGDGVVYDAVRKAVSYAGHC